MPTVPGLAGEQEKWGNGEEDQPNVATPFGVGAKDLTHSPQAPLSLPFDPHDSLIPTLVPISDAALCLFTE